MDNNGNIVLEDLYNSYEYSPETFNLLFTGKAILINHQPKTRSITFLDNATDVTDKNIDGPQHIGIQYKKGSTQDIIHPYGHVWAQVKVNDNWINMDNTKSYKYSYGEHDLIPKDTPTPSNINF